MWLGRFIRGHSRYKKAYIESYKIVNCMDARYALIPMYYECIISSMMPQNWTIDFIVDHIEMDGSATHLALLLWPFWSLYLVFYLSLYVYIQLLYMLLYTYKHIHLIFVTVCKQRIHVRSPVRIETMSCTWQQVSLKLNHAYTQYLIPIDNVRTKKNLGIHCPPETEGKFGTKLFIFTSLVRVMCGLN